MSKRRGFQVLLMVAVAVCLLVFSGIAAAQGNSENAFERVREVQELHTSRLLAMDRVEGTAIGYNPNGQLAVHVFTAGPGVAGLPKTLDGVPVHVEVTGKLFALPKGGNKPDKKPPKPDEPSPYWFDQPVPIGVSTGNANQCSSGTIGCRLIGPGGYYALSNNHVYAMENDAVLYEINLILQPGLYDTNCEIDENNIIGTLTAWVDIDFSLDASNTVDAAIALSNEALLDNATPEVGGYGTPSSTVFSENPLGLKVQKYGRTTGLTSGVVTAVNATVKIGYSSGTARFVNQIVITGSRGKFSNAGDSGSLIVTQDGNQPVGLLFAGGARQTIANRIEDVLGSFTSFGVSIDGESP